MDKDKIDLVAEAIWGKEANKRTITWKDMPEKYKDMWREDAIRVLKALEE